MGIVAVRWLFALSFGRVINLRVGGWGIGSLSFIIRGFSSHSGKKISRGMLCGFVSHRKSPQYPTLTYRPELRP
jgi:hypothetical protein